MTESERKLDTSYQGWMGVQAGDAIRLTKPWQEAKAGEIGIIDGMRHRRLISGSITFNYSAFRDDRVVSCSGGPGTIITYTNRLVPTGETMLVWYWRWKDGYTGADNGERYAMEVNIWEWDGTND
ncbi:hypothetical protein [Nostoc sp. DedQUE07]|uniref:hypothetical protein n=1 Tax=Nostoc sp. DedQUE07 TaxID=3075392 RepID=UPI002AD566DD|nr:hypothetical protein [Nostoc sp. DedQUE07]MDZ8131875.1 hypothetical protein [Nostoc sp. DedQUE07]